MDLFAHSNDRIELQVAVEDPLACDTPDDPVVTTTRRAISRVAFVAAETASRFEREGIECDPMAWMMAPRDLFDGDAALDACLGRKAFLDAVLLHGLSIGLDASPDEIAALLDEEDDLGDNGAEDGWEAFGGWREESEVARSILRYVGSPDAEAWNVGIKAAIRGREDDDADFEASIEDLTVGSITHHGTYRDALGWDLNPSVRRSVTRDFSGALA